jgi:hypothetical protein
MLSLRILQIRHIQHHPILFVGMRLITACYRQRFLESAFRLRTEPHIAFRQLPYARLRR